MRIVPYLLLASSLISRCCSGSDAKWDEAGWNKQTRGEPGIPAFNGVKVDYKRNGKAVLKVELKDPVVIGVASKPERWGHFQFPAIYRSFDGQIVATWQMAEDSAASYGKGGNEFMLSSDGAKTWHPLTDPAPAGAGYVYVGISVTLPDGDRLSIHTPEALKVSELRLPAPLNTHKESYGRKLAYYRLKDLPDALQGVYLSRTVPTGKSSVVHASLDDPGAVRYTDGGLFPVAWWGDMKLLPDNSIVAGIYPMFHENETGGVDPAGVSFYRSTDEGRSWRIHGKILYKPDLKVDPNGNKRLGMGFTEPAFEVLSDGTFLCVMRTSDGFGNSPMYLSRSSDQGVTWSRPEAFTPTGVLPRLLQLKNGVVVLASGRPGVQLRFSVDGKGREWTDPFEMLPFASEKDQVSCGYTCLLATGPDRFLVIYSDFKFLNQNNEVRKAIKVREIQVKKDTST